MMDLLLKRRVMMNGTLPPSYCRIEYLESSGTQYINTGLFLNYDSFFEIDFELKNNITSGGAIFGARATGAVGTGIQMGHVAAGNVVIDWLGNQSSDRYTSSYIFIKDLLYRAQVSNNTFLLKDLSNDTIIDTHAFTGSGSCNFETILFGLNNGSTIIPAVDTIQIKKIIINNAKDNKSINLLPARRKSDSMLGMYDSVSGQFFTNAGTGSFIAGPDIV